MLSSMENNLTYRGTFQLNVVSGISNAPLSGATLKIFYTGIPENQLEELTTDSSGQTETIELPSPAPEYSLTPESEIQPYSEYTLEISADGYIPQVISGAEILPNVKAIQNISLMPADLSGPANEIFVIPAHTLYGEYPPKIAEDEIQPTNESGEIVLSRVVVPEYVVVHDGSPRDSTAKNYYVRYRDYIKNVASSEIYATWPEDYHSRQRPRHYVLYPEPGIYGIVQKPGI